ncbi:helix-turn-helix domain-containing protein [Arthrobacter sp. TMN-49]
MSTPKPASSNFLTIDEVAQQLRVSKMTVYRLVQTHEIEAVRFGRLYRVPQEAVDAYIERSAIQGGHTEE